MSGGMIEDCNAARQASKHVPQEDWDVANRKHEPRYLDFGPVDQITTQTVELDSDPAQKLQDVIWKTLSRETDGESDHWSNASIELVVAILGEFVIAPRSKHEDRAA